MARPSLSVVVLNYRRADLTDACVRSLRAAAELVSAETELLVLDNGSDDGSVEQLRSAHPDVRVEGLPQNLGFAGGVQRGIELTSGDWVALVNNDTELEAPSLARMLEAGDRDARAGAVAPQIRFHARRDLVNSAGLEVDAMGIAHERLAGVSISDERAGRGGEVFGATGCVALYRRRMLDELGGFDESFFAYLEDADLAWRARMAGWRTLYVPEAVAYHRASATVGEGSRLKYFLVGRNRMRTLAKNATRRQLMRYGVAMLAYDLAYVVWVAVTERSLSPVRGRLRGLADWHGYRRAGAEQRRPTALSGLGGALGALRMRSAYRVGGAHR